MRKVPLLLICILAVCACRSVRQHDVIANELRPSAYPLITIDPYTSGWSMSDKLYEGSVKHWTGKDLPLIGAVKVDGTTYRFMGTEDVELQPVVPTSEQGEWFGSYTTTKPADSWTKADFNDSSWSKGKGAFGTTVNEPTAKTDWPSEYIWVRRTFSLDEDLAGRTVYLEFSDDDQAVFYINGQKVFDTGFLCNKNELYKLPAEVVATLNKGENIITASCWNPHGNGLLDFGLLLQKDLHTALEKTAIQTSVDVQATQTHYTFTCGDVDLRLSFSAPLFMDDLDLLSRPVNYITYDIASNDGKAHDIEIYFEASPRWALDQPYQGSVSEAFEASAPGMDLVMLKSGSKEQNILAKQGDDLRIDWGYFYLAAENDGTSYDIGTGNVMRDNFVNGVDALGSLNGEDQNGNLALIRDLGSVKNATGKIMVGYDDIYSLQYFDENLRPYWNRSGTKNIVDQFVLANKEYDRLIDKCYKFDKKLMTEAAMAGGKQYAEMCAVAYRQAISAHKLAEAPNGDLLWLSKENNSNGSIGTVDITYPSSPLFLYYNPELAKALMNHIFYYSESGRWAKPFPSHDIGTYPLANGQTYGGDMPIEEGGNMLILTGVVSTMEGNAKYAEKHWDVLTTWANYLAEYGLDPENQLCTDDFAGHFAHNANLSVKAIMGVACYGRMAEMLGKTDVAEKYTAKAREMAKEWYEMANDGDHFRLTFDKPGTWSLKYNLVWDKLLGTEIFPKDIIATELAYYPTQQNQYGIPLDNRMAYTKTDWIMWTATLADDRATFESFIEPSWNFYNETTDRVPMSDWVWTDKPHHRGFKARSVVGGYWIKMLETKLGKKVK